MSEVMDRVLSDKLIAIVRGLKNEHMRGLVSALSEGGVSMIEVTFSQKDRESWVDTASAVSMIAREFGGRVLPGAGTVMTVEQVHIAKDAGARYIVAPNVCPDVIKEAKNLGMAAFPGALTPTECALAWDCGADAVKIFPAGTLGAGYIKAIKAPLSAIPMLAVGGISEKNAAEFIRAGAAGLGVGGNLVNKTWIEAGEFDKITALAREYVKAVK